MRVYKARPGHRFAHLHTGLQFPIPFLCWHAPWSAPASSRASSARAQAKEEHLSRLGLKTKEQFLLS